MENRIPLQKPNFSKYFFSILFKINNVIDEFYPYINSINDLNNLTYAAAILALKLTNQEPKPIVSNNLKNTPAWKTRIQNKINTFPKHLS
jgi:hypothetical protein